MATRSALISFLNRHGYLVHPRPAKAEAPELTHLLMDGEKGGRIALPPEAVDGFFGAYAEDLTARTPLYVIEKRSAVFKLCFDVDFKTMYGKDDVARFVKTVCMAVAPYFTDEVVVVEEDDDIPQEAFCFVCAVTDDKGDRKAPGLHLIFPFAHVDESMSLWIRSGVVHALHGLANFSENWNAAIDMAVLTTSGLRMVGSDKCRDCSSCKNASQARPCCSVCNRKGKLPENKIYWPWCVFPASNLRLDKHLSDMRANPGHAARLCSIRLPGNATASQRFRVPYGAPGSAVKKRSKPGADDPDKGFFITDDTPVIPKAKQAKVLNVDARTKALLTEAIRRFHPAYSRLEVKELLVYKRNGQISPNIWVKVMGYGSRFCLNKDADHTSQGIYFCISPVTGISQRCFSRKDLHRRCGLCRDFSSTPKMIGASLRAALFPDETASARTSRGGPVLSPQSVRAGSSSSSAIALQRSANRTAEVFVGIPSRPPKL